MTGNAAWWLVAHGSLGISPASISWSDPNVGKWFFAAVFALLLIWLATIPRQQLGQSGLVPWWRNIRVWAMLIAATQVVVYLVFG
jgi:hypothetical protein